MKITILIEHNGYEYILTPVDTLTAAIVQLDSLVHPGSSNGISSTTLMYTAVQTKQVLKNKYGPTAKDFQLEYHHKGWKVDDPNY